jgi:hypothetical protein
MENKIKINKKRILFEVEPDLYQQIKKSCEYRGISLRIFMVRASKERLLKESKYLETEIII